MTSALTTFCTRLFLCVRAPGERAADRPDHSSAAFLCFGSLLHSGVTMALSRKFSASKFFDEAREGNASVIQYIGESASAVRETS